MANRCQADRPRAPSRSAKTSGAHGSLGSSDGASMSTILRHLVIRVGPSRGVVARDSRRPPSPVRLMYSKRGGKFHSRRLVSVTRQVLCQASASPGVLRERPLDAFPMFSAPLRRGSGGAGVEGACQEEARPCLGRRRRGWKPASTTTGPESSALAGRSHAWRAGSSCTGSRPRRSARRSPGRRLDPARRRPRDRDSSRWQQTRSQCRSASAGPPG